ncbi:Translation initiation factor IF-2 [Wickerhamomyces ciferrii]|uniref:Translation initiation factor IF-2, mitochondrial n=1 Tax=Wickerhamomyces ciferrii (strain ATCC 14091 / BCRC 22168 / CBS 111 / JCM 3599 / NBRC 0793 / NRRL Y-1031 F-60-10) TaxID=1206466 RepID=K0KS22_WICCF|nr:Translation initiation factor IF-2 [Wickerhamomyces ciferrii]CCH44134.1 Translation initiation factor IF-2 [Wickerhamomyces ciferrii]
MFNLLKAPLRSSSRCISQLRATSKSSILINQRFLSTSIILQAKRDRRSYRRPLKRRRINIPDFATVSQLVNLMGVSYDHLARRLEEMGFEDMNHNFILDAETIGLIADEYGFDVKFGEDEQGEDLVPVIPEENSKFLKQRPPIVAIMGHVDHGKTTILDYLRKSSIVSQEHGGITQHIGAFSVKAPISKKVITFLDTPGHAAFLKMRERGATVTDIVVLVVAADDSVMPQTKEAIKHIKKSGVSVIVAINKCDKENANPEKVIADLAANDIDVEDYGGDTQTVKVSGLTGLNMDTLEESIVTLSEILDLKAQPTNIPVEGWVIESEVKKGMGPIATVLIRQGTLKPGNVLVAGNTYCKVRSIKDEGGKVIKLAGPSTPVELWGWKEVPEAGDEVLQAKDESQAKKVIETRINRLSKQKTAQSVDVINKLRLEHKKEAERQDQLDELRKYGLEEETEDSETDTVDKIKEIKFIVKADVSGSTEAIVESIENLGNDEVKCSVLLSGVGFPTDTEIDRASIANAIILCFNMKIPKDVDNKAIKKNVEVRHHNVIYHLIEDVTKILSKELKPIIELNVLSETDIKEIFEIKGKKKKITRIAGCKVRSGKLERSGLIKVMRDEEEIFRGRISTLKHAKDDVKEIAKGRECGVEFENWDKFQAGDVIQVYEEKVIPRFL